MDVVSWGHFSHERPDLAERVATRFTDRLCYLATMRPDGFPRVHSVGVNIRDDSLIVAMLPTSPKGRDLRRSGRYAVHCAVEDNQGGAGEVLLTGSATECEPAEEFRTRGWMTFDLHVGEVLLVDNDGSGPVATRWSAGPGMSD